jgi:GntR family transcriptional regulator
VSLGHRAIADQLRSELNDAPAGQRLATHEELAARFDVNRSTIADAIRLLVAEGLVETNRRGGTTKALPPVRVTVGRNIAATLNPSRSGAGNGPWEDALESAGLAGHARVYAVERVAADANLAERLGIEAGDTVVVRHRNQIIASGGAETVANIQHAHMALALIRHTPLAGSADIVGGVYAALAAAGLYPAWLREDTTARTATAVEADVLDVAPGSVVMEVWRTLLDADGRALEVVQMISNARRTQLRYDVPLDPPAEALPLDAPVPWSRYTTRPGTDGQAPWEQACGEVGLAGSGQLRDVSERAATTAVAHHLGVRTGNTLICRTRHMVIHGHGVAAVARLWVDADRARGTALADSADYPLSDYAVLASHGMTVASVREQVGVQRAPASEANVLSVRPGSRVLGGWRVALDQAGQPVAVVEISAHPDMIDFRYELPLAS